MSDAIESQGYKLEIGNGDSPLTFTEIKEIVNYQAFDGAANEIDVTHLQSLAKEFRMGLQDFGSVQIDVNMLPDDEGQELLRTAKASRQIQDFRMTRSDGSKAAFQGYVTTASESGGVDAKIDGSFNIRISGNVTFTAAP